MVLVLLQTDCVSCLSEMPWARKVTVLSQIKNPFGSRFNVVVSCPSSLSTLSPNSKQKKSIVREKGRFARKPCQPAITAQGVFMARGRIHPHLFFQPVLHPSEEHSTEAGSSPFTVISTVRVRLYALR